MMAFAFDYEPVRGPRSGRGQRVARRDRGALHWVAHDRGARPSFARAPEARMLLPYREGKAASTFTAIGAPACTAFKLCGPNSFNVLNILKKLPTTRAGLTGGAPPAGVFWGTLNAGWQVSKARRRLLDGGVL